MARVFRLRMPRFPRFAAVLATSLAGRCLGHSLGTASYVVEASSRPDATNNHRRFGVGAASEACPRFCDF